MSWLKAAGYSLIILGFLVLWKTERLGLALLFGIIGSALEAWADIKKQEKENKSSR